MRKIQLISIGQFKAGLEKKYQNLSEYDKQRLAGYLYIVLTLFSVSFFGIFAINPTLSTISSLKRQYEDDQFVQESLTKKISALNQLRQQYEQVAPHLELLESAVPQSNNIPNFTGKIQKIVEENNLMLIRFEVSSIELYPAEKTQTSALSITPPTQKTNLEKIVAPVQDQLNQGAPSAVAVNKKNQEENDFFKITLSVEGKETDIKQFISDIINIDRIITIDTTEFNKTEKDTFVLILSGKAYFNKNN